MVIFKKEKMILYDIANIIYAEAIEKSKHFFGIQLFKKYYQLGFVKCE